MSYTWQNNEIITAEKLNDTGINLPIVTILQTQNSEYSIISTTYTITNMPENYDGTVLLIIETISEEDNTLINKYSHLAEFHQDGIKKRCSYINIGYHPREYNWKRRTNWWELYQNNTAYNFSSTETINIDE